MIDIDISWVGGLVGLAFAIILILKKLHPVYSLLLGTIIGSIVGGASLVQTTNVIITGTQSVMGTVVRVIAAGVLAGVMMESGAAETIAKAIVDKFGEKKAILSLALSTMIITAVGVFIPVAVIIVAPIALSVGNKMGISKISLLLALSGGGKAGNIISPNPNAIAAANGFDLPLNQVMLYGVIPAIFGLVATIVIATSLKGKGPLVSDTELDKNDIDSSKFPPLSRAIVAPGLAVFLLMLSPIGSIFGIEMLANFQVDAMFILPLSAVIGMLAMGQGNNILKYTNSGINRMTPIVLILIGAGAIGGLISNSNLPELIISIIARLGISGVFLAPISGILMAFATGSTSTGVILATGSFAEPILEMGVSPIAAAVMIHTGATVLDAVPQGNYFHVSADSMKMTIRDRMKLLPYEACVGGTMTIVATILYGFILV